MSSVLNKIKRSLRREGFVSTVEQAIRVSARRFGNLRPGRRRILREAALTERSFDIKYGITTDAPMTVPSVDVAGDRWVLGTSYQALTPEFDFGKVLSGLDVDFEASTFVDIGAGMGRALFLAASLPFKAIIGVEYSESLCSTARDNLLRTTSASIAARDITIVHADAVDFVLPAGPLVIFLYNPFECGVMEEFVARVETSFRENPRRITVIYLTPLCVELWRQVDFLDFVSERAATAIFDTPRARYSTI